MSGRELRTLQDRESDWIMSLPGIHGTGIQNDETGGLALAIYCLPTTTNATKNKVVKRLGKGVPIMWVGGEAPVAELEQL